MRNAAVAGIAASDSPNSLAPIAAHVYYLLRNCSHRNFIRLAVQNGTLETLCMVSAVGILLSILGLLTILLVAFASPSIHHCSRWRSLAAAPFLVLGFSFLLAGTRGSCFLLLLFTRRQKLPWERIDEDASIRTSKSNRLKSFVRKLMIFDRKIKVKDQGLRNLQHKIIIQSVSGAIIATVLVETVFICLPIWK
jgi:hypothetical protein